MQPVTDSPADNPARKKINDDSQIQPSFPCPDIRYVGAQFLVGTRSRKVLSNDVGRNRKSMVTVCGIPEAPSVTRMQSILTHQTGNRATANRKTLILQFARHAWAAIGFI